MKNREDLTLKGFVAHCGCGEINFGRYNDDTECCGCGCKISVSTPATLTIHRGERNILPYLGAWFIAIKQLANAPIEATTYGCPHCNARIRLDEITEWFRLGVGKCPRCGEYVRAKQMLRNLGDE
jgi:hypothetical protein